MEYIIVENGIITAHRCGATKPENAITVPEGFAGYVGSPYAALKADLTGLKPLSQQVTEGIVAVPEGYTINATDTGFIRMEQAEIDQKYPPKHYAIEGSFESITVCKTFDKDGNFGYRIPEGLTEMETAQPGPAYRAENGKWIPDLEKAKTFKLSEINAACDSVLNAAVLTYPETEVLTFDQQTSEANAYLASQNPADAPLLTALAAGRGITLDDLVQRVIAKHDAFSLLSGYVIGQRQALEDRLELCETVGDVQAIAVTITLPEAGNAETA